MLTPWLEAFPSTARKLIQEVDHFAGFKLSDVIQKGPSKVLTQTTNAQPAIMATSIVILKILEREFDFRAADNFDMTLGHSLGEFAALVAGGYMTFQDSLYLVGRRAAAMSEATRKAVQEYGGEYGMVAIVTEPEYLRGLIAAIHDFVGHSSAGSKGESSEHVPPIEQVLIANINSRNQIVLSGNIERITTLMAHVRQFLGHDPRAVRLHSDSPFHSPIMKPAVAVMRSLLADTSRVPGREGEDIITFPGDMPCVSNVTARPFRSKEQLRELLARGCLETVRWWDSIRYLDQQEKVRRWVGIGPGKVGRNLVGKEVGMRGKDSVKGGGVWAITDPSEIEEDNPLHVSVFPSHDAATNTFTPIRSPLQFSLLLSSTIDVFRLRAKANAASGVGLSGDVGLLHAVDDRLAAYGYETNTGVRMVCVVDMRGRRVDASGGRQAAAGLRETDLKPVFRAMQTAYVRLLQNPFYEPDEHAPLGGAPGKSIVSTRFEGDMRRIGEAWTPGVTSL
ncbi:malonyl CoA-acyl carrier protein transacylase [Metarhizium album ARSEF 1941]|uniref:[acyl-carrier-protein] S-malonyltransferase n=1 Tax=Metarhizium album (strain ARSEF 1941) TaxID=1081103 RepID=A0A0B2WLM8_METAS|nr:malonyl CoA-acyl carrier protein transacylase [Metarhizium album ARSEF 1941]KHN96966.1 malonyl CoA-acyl carrier protein transacylase [Metarhizium album ARSEF 1941]